MGNLSDERINVKYKLSALWVSVMFLYVYGDFFTFFVPGHIQGLMDGNMGVGETTPMKLFGAAILMTIPSLMVFLSLAVKASVNQWLNIVFGVIYSLIMILIGVTAMDPWWVFYVYLAFAEVVVTLLIVWLAWTWPKQSDFSA